MQPTRAPNADLRVQATGKAQSRSSPLQDEVRSTHCDSRNAPFAAAPPSARCAIGAPRECVLHGRRQMRQRRCQRRSSVWLAWGCSTPGPDCLPTSTRRSTPKTAGIPSMIEPRPPIGYRDRHRSTPLPRYREGRPMPAIAGLTFDHLVNAATGAPAKSGEKPFAAGS